MRVKDVCERLGQGTASLGLPRYYLMVEGPHADGSDDLLLELKQARRSALAGLVPPSEYVVDGNADRISHAQGVHLVRGDRFYGAVEMDGLSFMVRERSPYRDDMDLDELSDKQWRRYAAICGASLAQSHALSDEAGLVDHDIEPDVLDAIGPEELFVQDIVELRRRGGRPGAGRPPALPLRPRAGRLRDGRPGLPLRPGRPTGDQAPQASCQPGISEAGREPGPV